MFFLIYTIHKILANPFLSTSGKKFRQKEEHWQGFLIPQKFAIVLGKNCLTLYWCIQVA
jgi:hypothetical protein